MMMDHLNIPRELVLVSIKVESNCTGSKTWTPSGYTIRFIFI